MNLNDVGIKDVLDWCMPVVLTWVGSGIRKYLKQMRAELALAKDSVIELNKQIVRLLERTEFHSRELENHERRITSMESGKRREKSHSDSHRNL